MIYHKNLTRKDLLKYGWKKLLMMAASEFSRATSLSKNGGGKELRSCLMRAKELFSVLETDPSIPTDHGLQLQKLARKMIDPFKADPKSLYNKSMRLSSV
ncbi:MAG: hypothetical protein JW782_02765 [Candidatus Saganbacteria bacterium]|nr:hypothetical protein [Candidatus Saganbacteria bacterium]